MTNQEFEIFVHKSRYRLLSAAEHMLNNRDEAEDVVQEALLKLLAIRQRLDGYRNIEALAMVVVRRLSLNVLRSRRRHPTIGIEERLLPADEEVIQTRYETLLRLIDTLPSKQQTILRLKHIEQMEVEDIASMVQMSHDAIYQNLSRARRSILEQFKNRKP